MYTQKKILSELEYYKNKDFSFKNGQILGSMCTNPHNISKKAYIKFLETNLGDPNLFPGTKEIEKKYFKFIKNLLNAPSKSDIITGSGGTESNITAIWIFKNLSKKREIIIPKSAHFSFKKIASLMDIKLKIISLDKNYCMDVKKIKNKINTNTAAIIGIAGSTELGTIDKIPEIGDICYDENIYFHIDAAFGGYIIPFLKKLRYDLPDFDFKIKGVSSISIDAHKMGCSVIPIGCLVIRNKEWLEKISVKTTYISCDEQAGILGTRPGAAVAGAYAISKYYGIKGYKKIVKMCMNNTFYLENKIKKIGLNLITKPVTNVIAIKLKNPNKIEKELTKMGWKVNHMKDLSAIRIVLMPHVTRKIIDAFIQDLKNVCKKNNEI